MNLIRKILVFSMFMTVLFNVAKHLDARTNSDKSNALTVWINPKFVRPSAPTCEVHKPLPKCRIVHMPRFICDYL